MPVPGVVCPIRKKHTDRVFPSNTCEPLDLKKKIRHTYRRSFSPGSSHQPGLKVKSCPDLLAINTHHEEEMKNKRGQQQKENTNHSDFLHTSNGAFDMQALTSHRWAVCRGNRVFVLSTKYFSSSTESHGSCVSLERL